MWVHDRGPCQRQCHVSIPGLPPRTGDPRTVPDRWRVGSRLLICSPDPYIMSERPCAGRCCTDGIGAASASEERLGLHRVSATNYNGQGWMDGWMDDLGCGRNYFLMKPIAGISARIQRSCLSTSTRDGCSDMVEVGVGWRISEGISGWL